MRYAVLSDVHANLHALRAVVLALEEHAVDAVLCAGDVVGYGPHPNECIDVLVGLDARCVAGNHDLMALGVLDEERSGVLARQVLAWTREVLTPRSRTFLGGLPRTLLLQDLLLAHGSPGNPEEYVRDPVRALEVLSETQAGVALVVVGHTHHQWVVGTGVGEVLRRTTGTRPLLPGHRYLLNPGSVGQSRDADGLARFMVLDRRAGRVELLAVPYDVQASAAALRGAGLPVRALHARHRSLRESALGVQRRMASRTGRLPAVGTRRRP